MPDRLIEEIRDRFEYAVNAWREIYEAGDEDMRYVSGEAWDSRERAQREKLGRPCLSLDELGQYINQKINDIRQNKRAIKVDPKGNGANDKTAEFHADLIRTIESKGAQYAYINGFVCALQRSLGFWTVNKRYVDDESLDQELYIRAIPNPRTVYVDPDAKERAWKDMRYAFIVDEIPKDLFLKQWPSAEIRDFTLEMATSYPHWIKDKRIQIAEYWKVKSTSRTMYLVGSPANPLKLFSDEIDKSVLANGGIQTPEGVIPILRERKTEKRQVVKYITNGVEILEEAEWEGKRIPIVPDIGKEYWMQTATGSKRIIESLIRKARDPQMLHNYINTAKMERIGQILKAPLIGYEGQFEGHEEQFAMANKVPLPYVEVKGHTEATGEAVLPKPEALRIDLGPIQVMEMADESAKRSIQSAMGMYNASVGKQDTSAKSGIAIKALDVQSDQGNFHFIDNHDTALEATGEILEEMIPYVYDTEREMLLRKQDESSQLVTINAPVQKNESGQVEEYNTESGNHDVTITTGPSYQSQREEAAAFVDLMIQNIERLPIDPMQKAKLLALMVKLKNLGPIGEQMADILDPSQAQDNPAQAMQQLQGKMQQMDQMIGALTEQLNAAKDEIKSREADNEVKLKIAEMQEETKRTIGIAQIDSREGIIVLEHSLQELLQTSQMHHDKLMAELKLRGNSAQASATQQPAAQLQSATAQ